MWVRCWLQPDGYAASSHFKLEMFSCKKWQGSRLFEIESCCKCPGDLPSEEIFWQNYLYNLESFYEMNTGVFSLKQI